MAELSATAYPVDKFVSIPFNAVVLVTFGLISAHIRPLACLISIAAFAVWIAVIQWQEEVYAQAAWKDVPAAKISQDDVTEFLTLGLGRWISSFLYHASVIKVLWKLVPIASAKQLKQDGSRSVPWTIIVVCALFFAFHLVTDREGAELSIVVPLTGDWSIYYHFYACRLAESLCSAFQVSLIIGPKRKAPTMTKAHAFVCSVLMLFQICRISQHPFNYCSMDLCYAGSNILIQILVLKRTFKHFRKGCVHLWLYLVHTLLTGLEMTVLHPITLLLAVLHRRVPTVLTRFRTTGLEFILGPLNGILTGFNMAVQFVFLYISTLLETALMITNAATMLVLQSVTDMLTIVSTGMQLVIYSTSHALIRSLQHRLPPLQNSLRSIRTGMAEVVSTFSHGLAIVLVQFFDAWRRQALHWQDDDYLVQETAQVHQRNQRSPPPAIPAPRPVQCVSCNSLDQSALAVQRLNTPPAHHTYESVLVLMEHHMEIVMEPPAPIREPVAPIVLPQNLTSLEVVPQQASD